LVLSLYSFTLPVSVVIVQEKVERGDKAVPEAPNPHKAEATAVQADRNINPAETGESTSIGFLRALLEIGREHQRIIKSLCDALLRGDGAAALGHPRKLSGLPSQKSPISPVST